MFNCLSHPNPSVKDIQDILQLFDKMEGKKFLFPSFLAARYDSMPPVSGFDAVASVLCTMRDEVAALRSEVCELRLATQKDSRTTDNVECVLQDVADIKRILITQKSDSSHRLNHNLINEDNGLTSFNSDVDRQASLREVPQPNIPTAAAQQSYSGVLLKNPVYSRTVQSSTIRSVQKRSNNVIGTKTATGGLSGASRIFDLFVGGCGLETTEAEVVKYCGDNQIVIKKCESLSTRSEWYKSFKISVEYVDREKLLSADFWPEGVIIRKFFKARQRSQPGV